jgi:Flp pilus assembly protein CpaB
MRQKGRFFIIVGVLLAVIAALMTFNFMSKSKPVVQAPTTRKVAVAITDIAAGTALDPLMVEMRDMPIVGLPADAIATLPEISGLYARTAIYSGQVLQGKMLADAKTITEGPGLAAALVPAGKVAYPFPITLLSGVAYALSEGDHVDVLVTFRFRELDPTSQVLGPLAAKETATSGTAGAAGAAGSAQLPRLASQLTLQDIEILKVGSWLAAKAAAATTADKGAAPAAAEVIVPPVVTLLLSQQDALVLQYARESGAVIELALRNSNDHDPATTESVTLDYMVTRFNISVPRKGSETILP